MSRRCTAMSLPRLVLLLVSIASLVDPSHSQECTPLNGNTKDTDIMDAKFRGSQIVVNGVVKNKIPRTNNGDIFDVEFDVKCYYKTGVESGPLTNMITVNDFGMVPNNCYHTSLTYEKGEYIILYLHRSPDNGYRPTFTADKGGEQFLDEINGLCSFKAQLPTNVEVNDVCNPGFKHDDDEPCISAEELEDPTQPPTVKPKENVTVAPPTKGKQPNVEQPSGKDGEQTEPTPKETVNGGDDDGKEVPYEPATEDDGKGSAPGISLALSVLILSLLAPFTL